MFQQDDRFFVSSKGSARQQAQAVTGTITASPVDIFPSEGTVVDPITIPGGQPPRLLPQIPGGGSGSLVDIPTPEITDIDPNSARTGQKLTISGRNLSFNNEMPDVYIIGGPLRSTIACRVLSFSQTAVTIELPPDCVSGNVYVSTGFLAVGSYAEIFSLQPTIRDFNPKSGTADNTTVVITGTGLNDVRNVYFTGVDRTKVAAQITGRSANEVGVTVPAKAVDGKITVMNFMEEAETAEDFHLKPPAPNIRDRDPFTPDMGAVGTDVFLFAEPGTEFIGIDSVGFPALPGDVVNRKPSPAKAKKDESGASATV